MNLAHRNIRVRKMGDVAVVGFDDLATKVDNWETMAELGEELIRLAESGKPSRILLDFGDAEFLPFASFEAQLVRLQRRVHQGGGVLKMTGLHPMILETFRLDRLADFFSIHESADEALRAFADLADRPPG